MCRCIVGAIAAAILTGAGTAWANPHALPFSYPYATLPGGGLELEQYTGLTPVPAYVGDNSALGTFPRAVLVTEMEYGITDKLELGLYFQATTDTGGTDGTNPLRFDGIAQRLRYRLAEAGELPVDTSLYLEVSEFSNELEIEGKINLEKDVGRLQILVNLWGERELYYGGQQEWVINPTAGASFQITPAVHLGLENWIHAEYGGTVNANNPAGVAAPFNPALHDYLGPALLVEGNRFWVAAAPYLRLDNWSRAGQDGDQYGRFWFRLIVGIER